MYLYTKKTNLILYNSLRITILTIFLSITLLLNAEYLDKNYFLENRKLSPQTQVTNSDLNISVNPHFSKVYLFKNSELVKTYDGSV